MDQATAYFRGVVSGMVLGLLLALLLFFALVKP